MPPPVSKRLLQITVAILALIPTLTGAAGVLLGPAFLTGEPAAAANLDSHLRFLSGTFFAVGLAFYATVPSIERKGALFRLAAALVFTGGLARLISLWAVGSPAWPHLAGLVMELAVVPALVVWQSSVARNIRKQEGAEGQATEATPAGHGRRPSQNRAPRAVSRRK